MVGKIFGRNIGEYLRIAYFVIVLYFLYAIGFSLQYVFVVAIMGIAIILLRTKMYNKIDGYFSKKIEAYKNLDPKYKRIVMFVAFIILLLIIKNIVYAILALFGFDMQMQAQSIMNNMNTS